MLNLKIINSLFCIFRLVYCIIIVSLNFPHISLNFIVNLISIPTLCLCFYGILRNQWSFIIPIIILTWIHIIFLIIIFIFVPIFLLYNATNETMTLPEIKIALLFWVFVGINLLFLLGFVYKLSKYFIYLIKTYLLDNNENHIQF